MEKTSGINASEAKNITVHARKNQTAVIERFMKNKYSNLLKAISAYISNIISARASDGYDDCRFMLEDRGDKPKALEEALCQFPRIQRNDAMAEIISKLTADLYEILQNNGFDVGLYIKDYTCINKTLAELKSCLKTDSIATILFTINWR